MRVGVRHASPHVTGTGRPCRAAAGPVPPAGMCLVTPGWARSCSARPQSPPRGAGPTSPMQKRPSSAISLCLQWGTGVLPSPAALPGAGAAAAALPLHSSDLWMFAHSCLLMCLVRKNHWDGALLPQHLQFCSPHSLNGNCHRPHAGWEHSLPKGANPKPRLTLRQRCLCWVRWASHPSTRVSPKCLEPPEQMAIASPSWAQGKGAPFQSVDTLPSAARLACCPPA